MNRKYLFLKNGGQMGELFRSKDWTKTSLGAIDLWPEALRSAISISLNSGFPIAVYWGKDLNILYNDAYVPILGTKHPHALGLPGQEAWSEIWDGLRLEFETVMQSGESIRKPDALLLMNRFGYQEECYFDYTLSPIIDIDGKVVGVFNAVIETSFKVIGNRRTQILQQFLNRQYNATTIREAILNIDEILKKAQPDITEYHLEIDDYSVNSWDKAFTNHQLKAVENNKIRLPLSKENSQINGYVTLGLSDLKKIDQDYQGFLESVAGYIGTLLNNAYAKGQDLELALVNLKLTQSNEELASSNEELASANEELAASNEELDAINEELQQSTELLYEGNAKLKESEEKLQSLYEEMAALNEELRLSNEEQVSTNDQLKELYKQISLSQDELQLAINAAGLATWDLNPVTWKFTGSDLTKAWFGLQPEDEIELSKATDVIADEDRDRVLAKIKQAMMFSSGGDFDVYYAIINPINHIPRIVRAQGKALFNDYNEPTRFSGVLQDVTEIKKDEQRKNDFIAMVSHELKTPLTSMNGYLQVLQGKANHKGDVFTTSLLGKSTKQIGKMTTLINGFLNVSRLESGKIHMDKTSFDLAKLIIEIEEESNTSITSHHVIFAPVVETWVHADRDKIGQVINNLISNAVKYSPSESIINVACVNKDGKASVSVIDQGMGISKQDLPKLFDRFYRVQHPQSLNISGFGIGLYLCSEIIKRHEGSLWADSELGKGSTFHFTLPVIEQPAI